MRKNTHLSMIVAFVALVLLWAQPLYAQFESMGPEIPESTITLSMRMEPAQPRPGEHARIIVQGDMHPGWHVYSVVPAKDEFAPPPTDVKSELADGVKALGPFYENNPYTGLDPAIGMELSYHKKTALFYQNIQLAESVAAGQALTQKVTIRYQTCSDEICLPPTTETFDASFTSGTGPVRPDYEIARFDIDPTPIDESTDELAAALEDGIWGFLGLAVISGLLALLTPCVFPMIPVTIAFFTKQENTSYGQVVRLSGLFGLGIIGTYTVTGMGLSVLLGATGAIQLATNGYINFAIGGMFTVFAFSLMGFFTLSLPAGFSNRMDQLSRKSGGPVGILLMGLVFTLTSFTCTVQFVGTMLIAASQGHWLWPILGMLVFATVFAFPFFILGLVPKMIQRMQSRSGSWLAYTKIVLGLVELAAAFKFFSNADLVWQWGVIDRDFVLISWAILALLSGAFLLGMVKIHDYRVEKTGVVGFSSAFIFLFLGIYLFQGLNGAPLHGLVDSYLPPELSANQSTRSYSSESSGSQFDVDQVHALPWSTNLSEALAQARAENKKVFVDFTGYTCVNCRWMEKNVFADPLILEEFKRNFVLVQLYTDGGDNYQSNQSMQVERFNTLALPFYVVLDANDRMLSRHAGIMRDSKDFLNFLNAGGTSI